MIVVAVVALLVIGTQQFASKDDEATVVAGAGTTTTAVAAATSVAGTTAATTAAATTTPLNTVDIPALGGTAPASTGAPGAAPDGAGTNVAVAPSGATGVALDPAWPKQLYVLSDSVVLSGKSAIPERFAGWQVEIDGKAALMLKKAEEELQARGHPIGSVAVVALGYNSLWEKNRRNFDRWASQFDKQADALLDTLKSLGAKKIVWVTLRQPTADTVPAKAVKELPQYSWYFPYVNERLHELVKRHPEVGLADWTAVSNRNGITYDSIHLNTTGAEMMADVIAGAVGVPPTA
jgi:hypothetical protein